ncbi:UNVERIFIED_CONTAM: WD repeat-containing protein 86 [Trichonephila clavipes]
MCHEVQLVVGFRIKAVRRMNRVFTGCADTYSRMFKAKTGECKRVFKGHTKAIVHIEPVYDKLYTVSVDGTLRVWDTTGILEDDPNEIDIEVQST